MSPGKTILAIGLAAAAYMYWSKKKTPVQKAVATQVLRATPAPPKPVVRPPPQPTRAQGSNLQQQIKSQVNSVANQLAAKAMDTATARLSGALEEWLS